jgi:hypothetical protein
MVADLNHLLPMTTLLSGLALMVLGFWGSSQWRSPFDGIAACGAPIGLLLSIIGVIVWVIPTFFSKL